MTRPPGDAKDAAGLPGAVARLRTLIDAHLAHEEAEAIRLIRRCLTADDVGRIARIQRRKAGLSGARTFLPWILDQATPADRSHVLRELPPPLRWFVKRWEHEWQAANGNTSRQPTGARPG